MLIGFGSQLGYVLGDFRVQSGEGSRRAPSPTISSIGEPNRRPAPQRSSAWTRPVAAARPSAAKSRSFWSAYACAKRISARSKLSPPPR